MTVAKMYPRHAIHKSLETQRLSYGNVILRLVPWPVWTEPKNLAKDE